LSAASYEAARLLCAEAPNGGAEITVTPSGQLQISIRTSVNGAVDRQAVSHSVAALANALQRISIEDSSDSLLVTLSVRVPLDSTRPVQAFHPAAIVEFDGSGTAGELVEENARLRRAVGICRAGRLASVLKAAPG